MITFDSIKVKFNILPQLEKAICILETCCENACYIKRICPKSIPSINEVTQEIFLVKKSVNNIKLSLNKKVEKIKQIENKKINFKNNISETINVKSGTSTLLNKKNTTELEYSINKTGAKIVKKWISFISFIPKVFDYIKQKVSDTCSKFFEKVSNIFSKKINYTSKTNLTQNQKENELNRVKELAISDSQINVNGKFDEFTDFQNIMMSDFSLLELLYDGDENNLKDKTISELYKESLTNQNIGSLEFANLEFDGEEMLKMTDLNNRKKYRNLVLGKLVRYGFSDIKIKEKISGKDGFDAFVLEDKNGEIMVYFPCTNLVEIDDYLYDSYPLMDNILYNTKFVGNLIGAKNVYDSQQTQAKQLMKQCLEKYNTKINVSGFSLGGSLAECSYLDSYKRNPLLLGNIVLFNPYHNRLTVEDANILKKDDKLKLYVCEGDSVSTVFNYESFSDVAKPVYIDYKKYTSSTVESVDNNNSLLNKVVNSIKNDYCNNLINICNKIKKFSLFNIPAYLVLNIACESLNELKKQELDAVNIIKIFNKVVNSITPILKAFGYDINKLYNLEFLKNLQYIETIFTSTHLTYTVDSNKEFSFDKNGNIKTEVVKNGKTFEVQYPSFDDVSTEILGSNPYKEVSKITNDLNL